jgi:hypothetical protein
MLAACHHYLIFAGGVLLGVFLGFIIVGLLTMSAYWGRKEDHLEDSLEADPPPTGPLPEDPHASL